MNKKQKEAKQKYDVINDFIMAWRKAHNMEINSKYEEIHKTVLFNTFMEMNLCSKPTTYKRFNQIKKMFNTKKVKKNVFLTLPNTFWLEVQKIRKVAGIAYQDCFNTNIEDVEVEKALDAIKDAQENIDTTKFYKYFYDEEETPPWAKMYKDSANQIQGENMKLTESQEKIARKCRMIEQFLLQKNKQYGDSVLAPIRVFSKANSDEQIRVRIDDKLNRLLQGDDSIEKDEDVIMDLIGYLILLLVSFDE